MSHQAKICETAAVSHIESCHPQFSYVPLIVRRDHFSGATLPAPGLLAAIDKEVAQDLEGYEKEIGILSTNLRTKFEKATGWNKDVEPPNGRPSLDWATIVANLAPDFEARLEEAGRQALADARSQLIARAGAIYDKQNTKRAIEARIPMRYADVSSALKGQLNFEAVPYLEYKEVEQLGLFYSEAVCYRCEALTYEPCGIESTILPGEKFSYSNTLKITEKSSENSNETVSQVLTTEDKFEQQDTFDSSYERKLHTETDVKTSLEAGFKIPFKVLTLDIKLNTSLDFKKIVDESAKYSSSLTRKRFQEVVRELKTSSTFDRSRSFESQSTVAYDRQWENKTNSPLTFIRRQAWCKTSVVHKRTNVQLAWSGCIKDPGRDLCTPENIETKLAPAINAIREKWAKSSPPETFGQRPANQQHHSDVVYYEDWTGSEKQLAVSAAIPSGYVYFGNPVIQVVESTTSMVAHTTAVLSQPSSGSTGGVSFLIKVDFENALFKQEKATVRVNFEIAPIAAQLWDSRVAEWRNTKADEEIAMLIDANKAELEKFLASDQAHAAIIRRVMEDFFGVNADIDCCELIKKLHRLFDFGKLCYSLYPVWNAGGIGCQSSRPPNIYTAKCLSFYLPIYNGMEAETLALLGSISAIPWSSALLDQYLAYVSNIEQMRETFYKRAFDPTGWDVKFDQPMGYQVTPYDTPTPTSWSSAHESSLNYEVLDAFTIAIPGAGFRIDPRPPLCG